MINDWNIVIKCIVIKWIMIKFLVVAVIVILCVYIYMMIRVEMSESAWVSGWVYLYDNPQLNFCEHLVQTWQPGSLAERSKAPASGAGP